MQNHEIHGAQVDVDDFVELRVGKLEHASAYFPAGIVEPHIDSRKPLQNPIAQALHVLPPGSIGHHPRITAPHPQIT